MKCSKHLDQSVTWVCFEQVCDQRVMCSRCAVKLHPKEHKLEELSSVVQTGILATYKNNPNNENYGLSKLCEQASNMEEILNHKQQPQVDEILISVQQALNKVTTEINLVKDQVFQQLHELSVVEEQKKQQVFDSLKEQEFRLATGNFDNSVELSELFEESFQTLNKYVVEKEREYQDLQNSNYAKLKKKLDIIEMMQSNFSGMVGQYFQNQFQIDFQQMFEMQLQTLSFDGNSEGIEQESDLQSLYQEQQGGNVSDTNGFYNFLQKKWKQDYDNISYGLNKFTLKLCEGVKYAINEPLNSSPKKQQPLQTPARVQQQFNTLQTPGPMYFQPAPFQQPMMIQYLPQYQQPYMLSPKPYRIEEYYQQPNQCILLFLQVSLEQMAQSQIVYMAEEPQHQIKKIEVQPICQRMYFFYLQKSQSLHSKDNREDIPLTKQVKVEGNLQSSKIQLRENMQQHIHNNKNLNKQQINKQ